MKREVIGKCKLCLSEGVRLLESHLLPAGLYRRLLSNDTNPHPIRISAKGTRSSSEQITDNVLCKGCETRLHASGENYVLKMAASEKGFPLLEELLVHSSSDGKEWRKSRVGDSPTVKRDHLIYFALSVFWRAAVHRWPDRSASGSTVRLQLGDKNTEVLRRFLLGEIPLPATMNLLLYVLTDRVSKGALYAPSQSSKKDFRWGYGFVACGYMFNLLIGKQIDPVASKACLVHSPEQFIWIRDGRVKLQEAAGRLFQQQAEKSWPR